MGRKMETRQCGRAMITVTQFDALRALPLGAKLMRVFGPALVELSTIQGTDDVRALAGLFAELFPKLEGSESQALVRELLACATAQFDNKVVTLENDSLINAVFESDLMALIQACAFSVEVNFSGFFDKVRGGLSTPQAKVEPNSNLTTT